MQKSAQRPFPWCNEAERLMWRAALDALVDQYGRKQLIETDPVSFVHRFSTRLDIEVAGLLASALAFGGVAQIKASLDRVLALLGGTLAPRPRAQAESALAGFKHRWTTGADVAALLSGAWSAQKRHGALEALLLPLPLVGPDYMPAIIKLKEAIPGTTLLPDPKAGSACKRLQLFLRWMVRSDQVDFGIWTHFSPSRLLVPLDTHIRRISARLGLTARASADLTMAREITSALKCLNPEDPVRYDFALTRLGMLGICDDRNSDCDVCRLADLCGSAGARTPYPTRGGSR